MATIFAHMEGGNAGGLQRLWQLLGAFHPLIVHFPIALLLVAAFLEVISIWYKRHVGLRFAITLNLVLGTLAAGVAAPLGWIDAVQMHFEPDLKPILFWHRWLGTSTAIGAVAVTFLWFSWAQRGSPSGMVVYRITLWAVALILTITGHLGGLLVYGTDYFSP